MPSTSTLAIVAALAYGGVVMSMPMQNSYSYDLVQRNDEDLDARMYDMGLEDYDAREVPADTAATSAEGVPSEAHHGRKHRNHHHHHRMAAVPDAQASLAGRDGMTGEHHHRRRRHHRHPKFQGGQPPAAPVDPAATPSTPNDPAAAPLAAREDFNGKGGARRGGMRTVEHGRGGRGGERGAERRRGGEERRRGGERGSGERRRGGERRGGMRGSRHAEEGNASVAPPAAPQAEIAARDSVAQDGTGSTSAVNPGTEGKSMESAAGAQSAAGRTDALAAEPAASGTPRKHRAKGEPRRHRHKLRNAKHLREQGKRREHRKHPKTDASAPASASETGAAPPSTA